MQREPVYGTHKPSNQLAVICFVLSLVFPLALVLTVLSFLIPAKYVLDLALSLSASALTIVGFVSTPAAILSGHIAMVRAHQYPPGLAKRALAVAGLALGYVSLVLYVVLILRLIHVL